MAKKAEFDRTIDLRIGQTWIHALCPTQSGAAGGLTWEEVKVSGDEPLAQRTADKLRKEELLVRALSPVRLRMELDRVPLWRGNHVSVRQLVEDWSRYVYLPRVKDADVIVAAIREGVAVITWDKDGFAFAEGYDEKAGRYQALRAGVQVLGIDPLGPGLLVKPDVARRQMEAEAAEAPTVPTTTPGTHEPGKPASPKPTAPEPQIRRFHGRVSLDPIRLGAGAAKIGDEVVSHLAGLMRADVKVTMEITVALPDGASEQVVRTVMENCRTLKFESQGFESE